MIFLSIGSNIISMNLSNLKINQSAKFYALEPKGTDLVILK